VELNLKELHEKKIEEILDERVRINLPLIEKDTTIEHLLLVLAARDHVWVVDGKGSKKIIGIVTEKDMLRLLSPTRLPKYVFGKKYGISIEYGTANITEDVMCRRLITCSPDDKVGDILDKMVDTGLRRLPVIRDGEIIGEITAHYIIQILLGKR
jgi:predicted transcriptional regulator